MSRYYRITIEISPVSEEERYAIGQLVEDAGVNVLRAATK